MEKIKKISFYDFDGTLMDTPEPDLGKKIWLDKTGEKYPHNGWWGRPESIDINIFNIKPFKTILNQLNDDVNDSETYVVLLSSRVYKLLPQISKILDDNNINVDEIDLKRKNDEKSDRIKTYLNKFPNLETINIYDDRDKEMKIFSNLKKEIGKDYQVNIYLANKGKISLQENYINLHNLISNEVGIYIKKKL